MDWIQGVICVALILVLSAITFGWIFVASVIATHLERTRGIPRLPTGIVVILIPLSVIFFFVGALL